VQKVYFVLFFAICYRFISYGQIEGSNIILTGGSNALEFDCKGVHLAQLNRKPSIWQASSISDTMGNLLFYASDSFIYDNNFQRVARLDSFAESTTADLQLIIPNPKSIDQYYIFYSEVPQHGNQYSIHYCNYNAVTKKILSKGVLCSNEIFYTAAKVPGKKEYWIITQENFISAYMIDSVGHISGPVITKGMPSMWAISRMNNSCNQMIYVYNASKDSVLLTILDFNNVSGAFSLNQSFYVNNSNFEARCLRAVTDISQDDSKLYLPSGCSCGPCKLFPLVQYDISLGSAAKIKKSASVITSDDKNRIDWTTFINGPDARIYNEAFSSNFGVINSPDSPGTKCNYTHNFVGGADGYNPGIFLSRQDYWPSFSVDTFIKNQAKLLFNYNAPKSGEVYKWDFGDPASGSLDHDTGKTTSHVFIPGNVYFVRLLVFKNGYHTTFTRMVCVQKGIVTIVKDTMFCKLDSMKLDAGNPGSQFLWSTGDTTETITITKEGKYWVIVRNNAVVFNDTFNISIKKIKVDIGKDISICKGSNATIKSNIKTASYLWSTGDTGSQIQPKQMGAYWLKVDSAGCVGSDTVNLTVIDPPIVNIGSDTGICSGTRLKLQSNISNASYVWSTGDTLREIIVDKPGKYWLRVYADGCFGADTMQLTVNPLPHIVPHPVYYFCIYDSASIQISEQTMTSFKWSTGDTTQAIRVKNVGIYSVVLKNDKGCESTDRFIVKSNCPGRLFIPDAFSPNGDGVNDSFKAIGLNLETFMMTIYNRWGECVFISNDINRGWDGTFKGLSVPQGIYIYIVTCKFTDQPWEYSNGTLLLIR